MQTLAEEFAGRARFVKVDTSPDRKGAQADCSAYELAPGWIVRNTIGWLAHHSVGEPGTRCLQQEVQGVEA